MPRKKKDNSPVIHSPPTTHFEVPVFPNFSGDGAVEDDEVDMSRIPGEHGKALAEKALKKGHRHANSLPSYPPFPPVHNSPAYTEPQVEHRSQNNTQPIDILEQVKLMSGLRMVLMNDGVKNTIQSLECGEQVYEIFKQAIEQELLKMIGRSSNAGHAAETLSAAAASFQGALNNMATSVASLERMAHVLQNSTVTQVLQGLIQRLQT